MSDDLRKPKYKGNPNLFAGHCYVASEALFHIQCGIWQPRFIKHEGDSHWFLRRKSDGFVEDITALQFKSAVCYELARNAAFLTKHPSKRAIKLIKRVSVFFEDR